MTGRPSDEILRKFKTLAKAVSNFVAELLEKIGNFVVDMGRALLRSRAPRQKFDGIEDPYGGCSETTQLEWEMLRFNERCYFYPMRDCPGWIAGTKCSRMGDRIPRNANQEDNESWKDFLDRWKRESWLWRELSERTD
jgi:hypothetical protein